MHLIRRSLRYVPRRELEKVARTSSRSTPPAITDPPWAALEAFDAKWGSGSRRSCRPGRTRGSTSPRSCAFTDEVRRVVYTTNAIEALNRQLRKAIKTKGHFPSEDAARKLIYLAIQNATPQWTRTRAWTKALLAFKIEFGDRLPDAT